ncbi:MAG: N-acetylmuramoyl-L-alanine amidase [Fibrobacter sp.]|nr:N-acetylmuramoyl-L-alanine amidase [Fibrobacter sp.]
MSKINVVSIIVLFFVLSVSSQVSLKVSSGKSFPITSVQKNSVTFVSITDICEKIGYRWNWDRNVQQLTCKKNRTRLDFFQDNRFFLRNDSLCQLPTAVMRHGGTSLLPVNLVLELFNEKNNELKWNSSTQTIEYNESKYSIRSASCEKKENGVLLTVKLADSLSFDYTYVYPNLIFNFVNATVDTQYVKDNKRVGAVKTISSIQYKNSAQISIILASEIEEPVFDYVQDTRTLMVAIRPLKAKALVAAPKVSKRKMVIVIDPGHGGKDPGAIGVDGIKEKDVVFGISKQLAELLKKREDITVHLTRTTDIFIPLRDRTKFANDKKADLFVSVHANAISGNSKKKESTKGYKFYFLSQAKNEEDKLAAMRENAVIELEEQPQNYGNLQNVLIDLAGNEYLKESQDICILLDQKFNASVKAIPKLHLGVGQANFWVLNGAFMPSVLVEAGFITNSSEAKLLADKKYQKKIALAIYDAIDSFKKEYETGYE